ncbi:unnamed protein product [Aphanomyces euteiches]
MAARSPLRLQHLVWTFGAYLIVWVAVSISILHLLEVDYQSTLPFLSTEQEAPTPTRLHHSKRSVDQEYEEFYNYTKCFRHVDYGILKSISRQVVCDSKGQETTITSLASNGWSDGSLWEDFALDFTSASAIAPIQDPSEEGGDHDPRYRLTPSRVRCHCSLTPTAATLLDKFFPTNNTSWRCNSPVPSLPKDMIETTAILVARKDDHNPFFQLSSILNGWILVKSLGLSLDSTQLFFLDDGVAMETDTLMQKLLAPRHSIRYGRDIVGQTLGFRRAVFLPFEYSGPLVEHLDDEQLCYDSKMIADFRSDIFRTFGLPLDPHPSFHNASDPSSECIVTIISRRPYKGRNVARMWLNEDKIRASMIEAYPMCTFRSIDFATRPMAEQIALIASSRVVIGMHGAGMANVAFASPNTFVIELFPLTTFRFGYRNLCQYLDLHYIEVRDGVDSEWPVLHKTISERKWFQTFDLVMKVVLNADERLRFEERHTIQRRIHRNHILRLEESAHNPS